MFSHIMLGANDLAASKAFYDATFAAMGIAPGHTDAKGRVWWMTPTGMFAITPPIDGKPATCGNGSTIGLAMASAEMAAAWHAAGVANGGTAIEDPPGERRPKTSHRQKSRRRDGRDPSRKRDPGGRLPPRGCRRCRSIRR